MNQKRDARLLRGLLRALLVALFAVLISQSVSINAQQKRAAILQQRLTEQQKKQVELRRQLEAVRHQLKYEERLRQQREGDHLLPGELDRMRDLRRTLPARA